MNSGMTVLSLMVHRFKKAYLFFSIYMGVLVLLGLTPRSWVPEPLSAVLCLPFGLGLLMTVFGFVNFEADIASTASAYSPWLLRLPIKTRELALWPILAAATWGSLSWVIFAVLFVRPRGLDAPVWWPALMFMALALSMQAILWRPVKRGNIRLIFTMLLSTTIMLFGYIATQMQVRQGVICAIYAAIAVPSAAIAWWSLTLARTSTAGGIRSATDVKETIKVQQQTNFFKSPMAAQIWLEWRRQGKLLPLLTGLGFLAISLPMAAWQDKHIIGYTGKGQAILANIWLTTAFQFLPYIPLLFATVIGMGARVSDIRGTDGNYHLYYATRPLKSQDMVRAKMIAIAMGVAITALLTAVVMILWVSMPVTLSDGTIMTYFKATFARTFEREQWVAIAMIVVLFTAWTWRNQSVGAFVDYMPSREFAMLYPIAVTFIGVLAFTLFRTYNSELRDPKYAQAWSAVMAIALVIKIGSAIVIARKQIRLRPSSKSDILTTFAYWQGAGIVAAISVGLIVNWMHQDGTPSYMFHPTPEIMALMLVPLVRPLSSRLALELGRHR